MSNKEAKLDEVNVEGVVRVLPFVIHYSLFDIRYLTGLHAKQAFTKARGTVFGVACGLAYLYTAGDF